MCRILPGRRNIKRRIRRQDDFIRFFLFEKYNEKHPELKNFALKSKAVGGVATALLEYRRSLLEIREPK